MPKKTYVDTEIGEFTVTKKRNARRITLRIASNGMPNVTVPAYTPYSAGVAFLRTQRAWVQEHARPQQSSAAGETYELYDGTLVEIVSSNGRNSTQNAVGKMTILRKEGADGDAYVRKAITKYLSKDSENAILPRIEQFAPLLKVQPSATRFRATTSRWGSCNSKAVLTFSSFIAQLPNELIDYIVIHELSHIREMNHSSAFWDHVASLDPDHKSHRKQLHSYKLEPYLKKV